MRLIRSLFTPAAFHPNWQPGFSFSGGASFRLGKRRHRGEIPRTGGLICWYLFWPFGGKPAEISGFPHESQWLEQPSKSGFHGQNLCSKGH